jgi:hypothetical protein
LSSFDTYHDVVLETLNDIEVECDRTDYLRSIGFSYLKFLCSNETEASIKFPFYSDTFLMSALEYLLSLDLLVKILSKPRLETFTETYLFDAFNYVGIDEKPPKDYFIQFSKKQGEALFFGDDILVSQDRFVPLFKFSDVPSSDQTSSIEYAFSLFSVIARMGLRHGPVLIDLDKDLTLFLSKAITLNGGLLAHSVSQRAIDANDNLDETLDRLEKLDITNSITIKYPYNTSVDSRILREFPAIKKFELCLKTRTHYNEIESNELILLKREIEGLDLKIEDSISNFEILDTQHAPALFDALGALKIAWREANLNPYKSPYPAKWFLCVNKSESLDFWKKAFVVDFPLVTGMLLHKVNEIIELIYEIDWTDYLVPDFDAIAIVPKSNIFPEVFNSFHSRLKSKFRRVFVYIDQLPYKTFENRRVVIFDPFNKVLFANLGEIIETARLNVVCPDFLYFSHQPFTKLFLSQYQYDALNKGARTWYEENVTTYQVKWEKVKNSIVKSSIAELKNYRKKYTTPSIQESPEARSIQQFDTSVEESFDEINETEAIEFVERGGIGVVKSSAMIEITNQAGRVYHLKPEEPILLEVNSHVISTTAKNALSGLNFAAISEIDKTIDKSLIANKMAVISNQGLNWKHELYVRSQAHPGLFNTLGLSISKNTFDKDYLNPVPVSGVQELHLPRAIMDWEIVGDYLGIKDVETVWTFHKCRGNINNLKRAYRSIIDYISANRLYGQHLDPAALEEIAQLFEEHVGVTESESERISIAKSITAQITKQLSLQEIMSVNHTTHEQDT